EASRVGLLIALAHLPLPTERIESSASCGRAHALPPVAAHHEELRHVVNADGSGETTPAQDQREAGGTVVDAKHEGMVPVVAPVGIQVDSLEASIRIDIEANQRAPVVRV